MLPLRACSISWGVALGFLSSSPPEARQRSRGCRSRTAGRCISRRRRARRRACRRPRATRRCGSFCPALPGRAWCRNRSVCHRRGRGGSAGSAAIADAFAAGDVEGIVQGVEQRERPARPRWVMLASLTSRVSLTGPGPMATALASAASATGTGARARKLRLWPPRLAGASKKFLRPRQAACCVSLSVVHRSGASQGAEILSGAALPGWRAGCGVDSKTGGGREQANCRNSGISLRGQTRTGTRMPFQDKKAAIGPTCSVTSKRLAGSVATLRRRVNRPEKHSICVFQGRGTHACTPLPGPTPFSEGWLTN